MRKLRLAIAAVLLPLTFTAVAVTTDVDAAFASSTYAEDWPIVSVPSYCGYQKITVNNQAGFDSATGITRTADGYLCEYWNTFPAGWMSAQAIIEGKRSNGTVFECGRAPTVTYNAANAFQAQSAFGIMGDCAGAVQIRGKVRSGYLTYPCGCWTYYTLNSPWAS